MVEPADVRSVMCLDVTHPRAAGSDLVRHICQILSPSPAAPFQSTKSLHPTHFWVDRGRTPCLSLACCAASDTAPSCTPLPRPQNTLCVDTHAPTPSSIWCMPQTSSRPCSHPQLPRGNSTFALHSSPHHRHALPALRTHRHTPHPAPSPSCASCVRA